jgi:phenylacetate-coenzyme A ligase PaaK-like adenylate-forming protein
MPQTVLLNEVQPKQRYEVVITNFYGKPLLRYRTYDIVEFPALEDSEAGIHLPQMTFVGRSPDFIDIAGFIGLLDERMVWQAIINTGIKYTEWAVRKEAVEGEPVLRLYLETPEEIDCETVHQKVHAALKELNHDYADYEAMIEKRALEVILLAPGSYHAYTAERMAAGADLARLKPPHMNPSDEVIRTLMKHSLAIKSGGAAGGNGSGNDSKKG